MSVTAWLKQDYQTGEWIVFAQDSGEDPITNHTLHTFQGRELAVECMRYHMANDTLSGNGCTAYRKDEKARREAQKPKPAPEPFEPPVDRPGEVVDALSAKLKETLSKPPDHVIQKAIDYVAEDAAFWAKVREHLDASVDNLPTRQQRRNLADKLQLTLNDTVGRSEYRRGVTDAIAWLRNGAN